MSEEVCAVCGQPLNENDNCPFVQQMIDEGHLKLGRETNE